MMMASGGVDIIKPIFLNLLSLFIRATNWILTTSVGKIELSGDNKSALENEILNNKEKNEIKKYRNYSINLRFTFCHCLFRKNK